MKLTSQEEYGLRCVLQLARAGEAKGLTIPAISELEGLSPSHVAKLMGILRRNGFVRSARGQVGGYTLARPADKIIVGEVLAALGGRLFESDFCDHHKGVEMVCANSVDCSIRSLWRAVQLVVDHVLSGTTLGDLIHKEQEMAGWVSHLVKISVAPIKTPEVSAPANS